ncbi:hypothetical protein ACFC1I_15370 [Microbacterium sp. NPDC056044]|uniref:hypothetical protein n=1 Tax=Microbacterium sp. NPDC056044 TaxID=3345690 RepID=UPI0035DCCC19
MHHLPETRSTSIQDADADLVVGAVLVTGSAAPKLVTGEIVASLRPGAALADIAID